MTSFSILEDLTVVAQEDVEILINENDEDTFTDEGNNQEEDKPIKIDTVKFIIIIIFNSKLLERYYYFSHRH
jgi:hypothetical protein